MSRRLYLLISLVFVLCMFGSVSAQWEDVEWDNNNGAGDRRWDTAVNWDLDRVPGPDDTAIMDTTYTDADNGPIIQDGVDAECYYLEMGYKKPAIEEVVLTMTGGTLTVGYWIDVGGYNAGNYRFDMNGGNILVDSTGGGSGVYLGYDTKAVAVMNMDGGNIDTYGFYLGQIAGSLATVNMTGGTINTTYSFVVGNSSATLGLLNMTGGTINSDNWFSIGDWGTYGGNGRVNLHGGTINTYNLSMGPLSHMNITEGVLTSDLDLTVPTGDFFDPENDTPGEEYTGTLQRMVEVGRITAYDVNHGEIITDDVNYPTEVGKRAVVLFDYGLSNADKTTLTAATVDPNLAWSPTPFDGEIGVMMPYLSHTGFISWSAGNGAASHELYLGTDFDAVNNATTTSDEYVRNQPLEDVNDIPLLKWGQTYYWRVDEVNGETTWKGDVWTFATEEGKALDPNPADDQWWVPIEVVLNWTPGGEAVSHELYFSNDFDEVNDRSISYAVPGANSYDPGMLQLDTTYYWAVDEVNTAAEVTPWPGDVWSFKTDNHIFVDNFDSYADDYDMQDVWCDYWCNEDSGAEVFVETTVVYNGKSMDFYYDNSFQTGGYYLGSEIYADTADLDVGSNWTINGAKALWMVFYGHPDNSITTNDRMYVAVEDTSANIKVIEYPDMNDLQAESWNEWHIDLDEFIDAGVDLTNVSRVYLGFGNYYRTGQSAASGEGTVYFDEIGLWSPYCRPDVSNLHGDFDGDCVTDMQDLEILAADWLMQDYTIDCVAPDSGQLLAWYQLESDGTDSSTNGADANGVEGSPTYVTGVVGNAAQFDGVDDYLYTPDSDETLQAAGDLTIALWLNAGPTQLPWAGILAKCSEDKVDNHWAMQFGSYDDPGIMFYLGNIYWYAGIDLSHIAEVWHHLALVYDSSAQTLTLYLDGALYNSSSGSNPPTTGFGHLYIGAGVRNNAEVSYAGMLDDIRIYEYALSQAEIGGAMGLSQIYQPIDSAANVYDPEPPNSRAVNFNDYALMADNWLGLNLWP